MSGHLARSRQGAQKIGDQPISQARLLTEKRKPRHDGVSVWIKDQNNYFF